MSETQQLDNVTCISCRRSTRDLPDPGLCRQRSNHRWLQAAADAVRARQAKPVNPYPPREY